MGIRLIKNKNAVKHEVKNMRILSSFEKISGCLPLDS